MLFDILYPPELLEALSHKWPKPGHRPGVAIRIQTISVLARKERLRALSSQPQIIIPGLGRDDLVVCFLEDDGFAFFNIVLGVDEAFPFRVIETHEVTTVVETGVT